MRRTISSSSRSLISPGQGEGPSPWCWGPGRRHRPVCDRGPRRGRRRCGHRKGENWDFFPTQGVFDDVVATGLDAENLFDHDFIHGFVRFFDGLGHSHAFQRQAHRI